MADQLKGKDFEIVIHQLDQFSPEKESDGQFLEEFAKVLQASNVTNEKFLMETLSGCIEYKPLLDVVVNAFYIRDGKHCLLSERNLYVVVCYLAIFRLEELGLQQFSRLIKTMDFPKIYKFLRFFFSVMNLSTWIKYEWSQIYDATYVKNKWIEPLLKWQPKVRQRIEEIADKLSKFSSATLKITEPKEFNLTVPNPRSILVPELIPPQEKTKPVPETTYKHSKLKQQLEGIKVKNRRKAEELLLDANINQFRCAAPKLEHEHTISETSSNQPERFCAQKIKGKIDNIPVKLNATAILREGLLYQRKTEQEVSRIEHLLRGARDISEFLKWQKEMNEKDLEQQLAEVEYRRLQGKLSYEEAILARQNCIQENQKRAEEIREEEAEMRQQYLERDLQERKERKKLVQQVSEKRKNVKHARLKLQKSKHQIVQEVTEESRELLRQALEEEEETFKRRYELIQQIRSIEQVPFLKNKFIDLTQTGDHRVFGEMSIVELRERLALLKEAQKKMEEEKRDQIILEKQAKEQLLLEKLEQISKFRDTFGRAAALKQEEKKTKSRVKECLLKDERVLDLQKKIEDKSMERKIQTELLKNEKVLRSRKSKKKSSLENQWKELEESRQRQFKMFQHDFMSREFTKKMTALEARKIGTAACILRS